MGGKMKYIEMFGSFTEPFNSIFIPNCLKPDFRIGLSRPS